MKALTKRERTVPARVLADLVVVRLREAEQALRTATTIHQAKLVADVAAAQEVFAHRQQLGEEITGYAHQIKIHALAKLGELLKEMPKAGPQHSRGGGSKGSRREPIPTAPPTYADLGLTKKVASVAQQLSNLPAATRDAIGMRETTLAQAKRAQVVVAVRQQASLPDAKYRVLYADPPWRYRDKADTGAIQSGGAEHHYPSLSIAELCALPVPALCEAHAVLFLWVTSPLLFESAAVITAWGFTYKASFVWDKVAHNMGHYNSVRHEFLLVCVRGSCQPDVLKLVDSVQTIQRAEHSEKPEEFRQIIDALYPHGKRLELFARRAVEHWDRWGNEAPSSEATA